MTSGKRLLQKVTPFSALIAGISHPYRLAILYLLANEPMWPEYIARHIPVSEPLIIHHLLALRKAGWVRRYREGRHAMYALQPKAFKALPKLLEGTPFWNDTFHRV